MIRARVPVGVLRDAVQPVLTFFSEIHVAALDAEITHARERVGATSP